MKIAEKLQQQHECSRCGACCLHGGNMPMTRDEIVLIQHKVFDEKRMFFCDWIRNPQPINGYFYLQQIEPCKFYDPFTKNCTIYDIRPQACKNYPFIDYVKYNWHSDAVFSCKEARKIIAEFMRTEESKV